MKYKLLFSALLIIATASMAKAQHYIGVRDAYAVSNISTNPTLETGSFYNFLNPGIVYQYKHKRFFAFQTELDYATSGYQLNDTTFKTYSYELPILSQVYVKIWRLRPFVTGGAFVGYNNKREQIVAGQVNHYEFTDNDNRFEYGIVAGGGLAFNLWRFELQAEFRYQYTFAFLRKPHINSTTQYLNPTKMMVALNLLFQLPL